MSNRKMIASLREQLIEARTKREEEINYGRGLEFFAKSIANLHQPYMQEIDVSLTDTKNLLANLRDRMQRERLWCTSCRTQWPCKNLSSIRQLVRGLGAPAKTENMPEPLPHPEHPNMIRVVL